MVLCNEIETSASSVHFLARSLMTAMVVSITVRRRLWKHLYQNYENFHISQIQFHIIRAQVFIKDKIKTKNNYRARLRLNVQITIYLYTVHWTEIVATPSRVSVLYVCGAQTILYSVYNPCLAN